MPVIFWLVDFSLFLYIQRQEIGWTQVLFARSLDHLYLDHFAPKSQTILHPHYLHIDLPCESKLSHIWVRLVLQLLARVLCTEILVLDYRVERVQSICPRTVQA